MGLLRRWVRVPLVVLVLLVAVLCIRVAVLWDRVRGRALFTGAGRRAQIRWSRRLCAVFGLRLQVSGEPLAQPPALVVANHISWLDIPGLAMLWPLAFLSKAEVRSWPLIGSVATGLGTLYIERGRNNAAVEAATSMCERLREGQRVLFFPEGTTSDGVSLLPFRPRLFQAAVDSGAVVQPVAISYRTPDGKLCPHAPFPSPMPLLVHVIRLAAVPKLCLHIHVCAPIDSRGARRNDLTRASREAIAAALGHPERPPKKPKTAQPEEAAALALD